MTTPRALCLLALPVLATSCELPDPKPFFCGRVSFEVRDEEPSGDVELRAWMHQDDEEPGDVNFAWSDDATEDNPAPTWHPATIVGQVADLPSNADGVRYDFVWDSAADLGQGTFENISLRAVGFSECGAWDVEQVDELTVDNEAAPAEGCTVTMEDPESPQDGPITLNFTLVHPDSLASYVSPTWSADGGETWNPLSAEDTDCDGDGNVDRLSNLSTSPDGVEHCVSWDSQLDFAVDQDVIVRLGCGVGYAEDSEAVSDDFTVENDPTPGPDEVIITEIKPDSGFSAGDYLELYNRTGHIINLQDVFIGRWKSGSQPGRTDPSKQFTLSDPSGTLLIYPGEYMLITESSDEGESGCLEPDIVWDDTFSLAADSQIVMRFGEVDIAQLKFLDSEGWDFDEGAAWGLSPDALESEEWDELASWCEQSSTIPVCESVEEDELEDGTPGVENDACR